MGDQHVTSDLLRRYGSTLIKDFTSNKDCMEHGGLRCQNRTVPEPFDVINIPHSYGWNEAPKLWATSLTLKRERS